MTQRSDDDANAANSAPAQGVTAMRESESPTTTTTTPTTEKQVDRGVAMARMGANLARAYAATTSTKRQRAIVLMIFERRQAAACALLGTFLINLPKRLQDRAAGTFAAIYALSDEPDTPEPTLDGVSVEVTT